MNCKNSQPIGKCNVESGTTISELKLQIEKLNKKLDINRQSIRLDARGKTLKDSDTLLSLNVRDGNKLYVKDLGPQIGWKTVFLAEYAGPLFVYLLFYQRPWLFYGDVVKPISQTVQ